MVFHPQCHVMAPCVTPIGIDATQGHGGGEGGKRMQWGLEMNMESAGKIY